MKVSRKAVGSARLSPCASASGGLARPSGRASGRRSGAARAAPGAQTRNAIAAAHSARPENQPISQYSDLPVGAQVFHVYGMGFGARGRDEATNQRTIVVQASSFSQAVSVRICGWISWRRPKSSWLLSSARGIRPRQEIANEIDECRTVERAARDSSLVPRLSGEQRERVQVGELPRNRPASCFQHLEKSVDVVRERVLDVPPCHQGLGGLFDSLLEVKADGLVVHGWIGIGEHDGGVEIALSLFPQDLGDRPRQDESGWNDRLTPGPWVTLGPGKRTKTQSHNGGVGHGKLYSISRAGCSR